MKAIKFKLVQFIMLIILPELLIASGDNARKSPEEIVECFYEYLLNDIAPIDCPKLFYEPEVLAKTLPAIYKKDQQDSTAIIWSYLRDNKEILSFGGKDAPEQLARAQNAVYAYLFTSHREGQPFFEGGLSIMLMATPQSNSKAGLRKQVVFPMYRSDSGDFSYLISPAAITINGAYIDFDKYYDRTANLWTILGFKP